MKSKIRFPKNTCSISDDWTYKGMRVVWMENDFLKIGILVDRGSDIFEFRYKPMDVNFLLRIPGRLRNLQTDFSQMRNTPNQFEDHYYGGWQEIVPNSQPFVYKRASLGQHGEISLIPWKYAITENNPERVSLKVWGRPVRFPVLIEKTLTLNSTEASLYIYEKLTNEANTHLDIMWGHHIAFGLPFLKEGVEIETNARKMMAEPQMPPHRRFKPGVTTDWPQAWNIDGRLDDAGKVPPENAPPYSDWAFLSGFDQKAQYKIVNRVKNIGFALQWDATIFKYLWYWQERYATKYFPWWGNCYTVALEPWTAKWSAEPEKAIEKGEWLKLAPGVTLKTQLTAKAIEG